MLTFTETFKAFKAILISCACEGSFSNFFWKTVLLNPLDFSLVDLFFDKFGWQGAKIQLLDLPGIIEGAKDGKGRGQQAGRG